MKNKHMEMLGRMMRQYHRNKSWSLNQRKIELHTDFKQAPGKQFQHALIGFISGRRRIWVDLEHPRFVHLQMVERCGIDFEVAPFFTWHRHKFCHFVEIVAPIELNGVDDAAKLVELVKSILRGQTTIEAEFPGFVYGKEEWLREGNP